MINYDNVMAKADKYYAEIKSEKLQCDISLVPQQIQSDQIRALAKALVEEINSQFECDTKDETGLSRLDELTKEDWMDDWGDPAPCSKAILLKSEDWEGLYVDGKLVQEGHAINGGHSRTRYFTVLANQHNFILSNMVEKHLENEDEEIAERNGCFFNNLNEWHFKYLEY